VAPLRNGGQAAAEELRLASGLGRSIPLSDVELPFLLERTLAGAAAFGTFRASHPAGSLLRHPELIRGANLFRDSLASAVIKTKFHRRKEDVRLTGRQVARGSSWLDYWISMEGLIHG